MIEMIFSEKGSGFAGAAPKPTLRAAALFPSGCVARRSWSPLHFLLAPCQPKKLPQSSITHFFEIPQRDRLTRPRFGKHSRSIMSRRFFPALPTIAAAVGSPLPDDRKYDGYDLLPLLGGQTDESPRRQFAYYNGLTLEAVRQDQWKLHLPRAHANRVYWANSRFDPYKDLDRFVLNNLADDTAEKIDLANLRAQKTAELKELAKSVRHELGDWNMDGTSRPTFAYPGNLNNPNWRKERQKVQRRAKR